MSRLGREVHEKVAMADQHYGGSQVLSLQISSPLEDGEEPEPRLGYYLDKHVPQGKDADYELVQISGRFLHVLADIGSLCR